jgi:sulfite exporter TauE/SafE
VTAILAILVASLLGSVHCAGMCGGFVCFYAAGTRTTLATHIAYNAGRLVSYLLLGVMAGVDRAGALVGVSRAAAVLAGLLMVTWGASTLLAQRGIRLPTIGLLASFRSPLGGLLARVRHQSPMRRAGATGLLTTLLPCGWLYAFVSAAAGTGSVSRALVVMAVFWAGTVPALLAVGMSAQRLAGPIRSRLPAVTAAVVVIIGLLSIAGRLQLDVRMLAARPAVSAPSPPSAAIHARH